MPNLLLAILSSALISIFMRLGSEKATQNIGLLLMNYLTCLLLSAADTGITQLFPRDAALSTALVLGILQGALYLIGFVLFQFNIQKNGIVLPAVFMKLGLLVPMVISICFFHEMPNFLQILGFFFALGAIFLINMEKGQSSVRSRSGLLLLLLGGGMADAMSKIYDVFGAEHLSAQFLFYTFLTASVLCLAFMLHKKQRIGRSEMLYGFLVGIPNYFSARFLLRSLSSIPAVIAYPTFSIGTILIVTCSGLFFFREKLGPRQKWGIGVILIALALLNL